MMGQHPVDDARQRVADKRNAAYSTARNLLYFFRGSHLQIFAAEKTGNIIHIDAAASSGKYQGKILFFGPKDKCRSCLSDLDAQQCSSFFCSPNCSSVLNDFVFNLEASRDSPCTPVLFIS